MIYQLKFLPLIVFLLIATAPHAKTPKELNLSRPHERLLKEQRVDVPHKPIRAKEFTGTPVNTDQPALLYYEGQVILLNFWATWCTPCLKEMPDMEELHQKLGKKGLTVLAVAMGESQATVREFLKKHPFTFPIIADPEMKISLLYGVQNLPVTYLLNPERYVIGRAIGPRPWSNEAFVKFFEEYAKKNSGS